MALGAEELLPAFSPHQWNMWSGCERRSSESRAKCEDMTVASCGCPLPELLPPCGEEGMLGCDRPQPQKQPEREGTRWGYSAF